MTLGLVEQNYNKSQARKAYSNFIKPKQYNSKLKLKWKPNQNQFIFCIGFGFRLDTLTVS